MYKNFKEFLNEKNSYLRESQSSGGKYKPKNKRALIKLVTDSSIHLGDIDTSAITDFSELFANSIRKDFSGIGNWDV